MFLGIQNLNRRLLALVFAILVVPQALTFFSAEHTYRQAQLDEATKYLAQAARSAQASLDGEVDSLSAVAIAASNQPLHATTSLRRPADFLISFGEGDSTIRSHGKLPQGNLVARIRGEITSNPEQNELEGLANLDGAPVLFYAVEAPQHGPGHWVVAGHNLDSTELDEIKANLGFDVSLVAFENTRMEGRWRVLRSTNSGPRLALLNQMGAKAPSLAFRYSFEGTTVLAQLVRVRTSPLGQAMAVVVEHPLRSDAGMIQDMRESFLLSLLVSAVLALIGLVVYAASSRQQAHAIAEQISELKEGTGMSPLDAESLDLNRETVAALNELTFSLASERAESRESRVEIEQKNYELERKVFELNLVKRLVQATNFIPDPLDTLGAAMDEIMRTFSAEISVVMKRNADSDGLQSILVKRKVPKSGFLATSRELSPGFTGLDARELAVVESLAALAISRGSLAKEDLPEDLTRGRQVIALPFKQTDSTSAAIVLMIPSDAYFFTEQDAPLFSMLGIELTAILSASRRNDSAVLDPLTRLYNHRFFMHQITQEVLRARRSSAKMSLLVITIDRFQAFAERSEWKEGEDVIKDIAALIRSTCRTTDILCRKEGAEFYLLLPDTPMEGAAVVIEKLRTTVESNVTSLHLGPVRLTISIGAAIYPNHAILPKDLLETAKNALAEAQKLGGNRGYIPKVPERAAHSDANPHS